MRIRGCREESAEDATLRLVLEHAAELLRFARRFTYSADDAHDAYQRAVEILVRRMRVDPPDQPLPFLRTVLRHEALAVRAERDQVGSTEVDFDRHEDRAIPDPAERAVRRERLRHTAEALQRLKPQEATALVLRAEGLSYQEIAARMGWTYTKTNRCVTEGRRALLKRIGAIESGEECTRWLPLLSALADGEASARQVADLRPHLRACPACRATLRDCHGAPAQVALLVPPAVVPAALGSASGSLLDHAHVALHAVAERATLLAARVQGAFEALPATKVAAVAASTAALAGGGVALEQSAHERAAAPSASRAAALAAPTAGRLTTIAFPVGPQSPPLRQSRRSAGSGSEFAAHGSTPPEFASRPPTAAPEFTPTRPPPAAAASTPQSQSDPQSEFGGP
ncbi:MAG: sigma-70 family RNA polymerase sigma factor [Actinobacteria bacterium]|nr:sigma-70 family RNA polymerase sigma factor [Actinomycetota bacterium]